MSIRYKVFVDEQGFVDDEDEIDKIALHLVSYDEKVPIATCRIFAGEGDAIYLLGRLAVLKEYRGKGEGSLLLRAAEENVKALGGKRLMLHSQYNARGFYEKCGYIPCGEVFFEQDCPYIMMRKKL